MDFEISKKNMICPFCRKEIFVGDEIGQVEEDEYLGTKFSWDIFGIKETNYIRKYSVYACRSCCRKIKAFQIISNSVMGAVIFSWIIYCAYNRVPNSIFAFVFLAIAVVSVIAIRIIRWILRIKKII